MKHFHQRQLGNQGACLQYVHAQRSTSTRSRQSQQVIVQASTSTVDDQLTPAQLVERARKTYVEVPDDVISSLERTYQEETSLQSVVEEAAIEQSPMIEKSSRKGFWQIYSETLAAHPIPVKSATSFLGFAIGDILSQNLTGGAFDTKRMLRMMMFGMMMDGPVGHVWYTTLDKNVFPENPTSTKAVLTKTFLDQLVWAPFFSSVFFTFINLVQGHPEQIQVDISQKLLPMLLANYVVWPLAHIINFRFIPSQQRILYINVVSVFWCAYMSYTAANKL